MIVDIDLTILGYSGAEVLFQEICFVGLTEALENEIVILLKCSKIFNVVDNFNILALKESFTVLVSIFRELVKKTASANCERNLLAFSLRIENDLTSKFNTNDTTSANKDVLCVSNLFSELGEASLTIGNGVHIILLNGSIVCETSGNYESVKLDVRVALCLHILDFDGVFLQHANETTLNKLNLVVIPLGCVFVWGK